MCTALGTGRARIVRQLLTESLLLSLAGGMAGLLLSQWAVSLLSGMVRADLPSWMKIEPDWRVLAFTAAVSILTGVLAGLVPALQVSRPDLNDALKEGTRGTSGGRASHRLRRVLVVAEVALALVLLVGAGLMLKSFARLQQADLGFNAERLLTMRVALPWRKYSGDDGPTKMQLFYRQALVMSTASSSVPTTLRRWAFPSSVVEASRNRTRTSPSGSPSSVNVWPS